MFRWWRKRQVNDDFDRELRAHLDLETREQEESGLEPADAYFAARREAQMHTRL